MGRWSRLDRVQAFLRHNGERRGFNTELYTSGQVRRVARAAFELAASSGKKK